MSVADRLNKLTTDITNAYTSIENKGGTIPANKNTENMSTAINSIEVIEQATAEGESLSLTNTKAMPYSDYVIEGKSEQDGEPSPSIPSEIHSVADDDINIFNAEKIENPIIKVRDNGKTIIMPVSTSGNGNINTATKLNILCPDLQVGDVIYIRFKRNLNNNRNKFIYLYGSNKIMYASEDSPSYTITQDDLNSSVFLYGNDYDYGETEQCIITDFKIQKNTVPIKYSPYNQGTVTIKQRGKNWFDYAKASDTNNTYITQYRIFEIDNLKPNTHYNINNMGFTAKLDNQYCYLWDTDTYSTSNKYLLAYVNQYNTKTSFISNNEGKIYLAIYPTDTTTWESVISYLENAQIEERKQFNPIRTISNATRLHYTNRTIT